jgi:aerobic-type carbon monoxide dehydrogenase small subunit (CoxS/CutS family)
MRINFELNGKSVSAEVSPHQPLRDILRSQFDLTGVKVGCHSGRCGVCSVLLDDRVVKSCLLMAPKANGRSIATIEGLSTNGELHYVQQAFKDNFALQCGYCTPGFIMATVDYLSSSPSNPPLRDEIKSAIKGNVCRCTGYEKIISAVSSAIISSEN